MAVQRLLGSNSSPSLPTAFVLFSPFWLGVGPGGRRACPQQEMLSVPSSSPDGHDRRQPERTAPRGGLRRGCTLQGPKFPGSPHRATAPFVQRSGAAGQLRGSSAARLRPAAQMCVFAQPSPGSEGALLGIMKGGLCEADGLRTLACLPPRQRAGMQPAGSPSYRACQVSFSCLRGQGHCQDQV